MAKFKTKRGKTYKVKITIPVIKDIKSELGINLGNLDEFIELAGDVVTFVDALYLACEKHLSNDTTPETFGESLAGDDLESAWGAFERAYLDFCPSHQKKTARRLMARIRTLAVEMRESTLSKVATSSEGLSE